MPFLLAQEWHFKTKLRRPSPTVKDASISYLLGFLGLTPGLMDPGLTDAEFLP
jgi:hypothetical protein